MAMKRVFVSIGSRSIPFSECLVKSILLSNNASTQAYVTYALTTSELCLFPSTDTNPHSHLLEHPPYCPIFCHPNPQSLIPSKQTNNISLASCLLVESSDSKILLTRRAKSMRNFPHVWVPPGGTVDPGETPQETAFRETREEVGIDFRDLSSSSEMTVLGLWESVYPPTLDLGSPLSRHLIFYGHVKSSESAEELRKRVCLSDLEADGFTWIDRDLAPYLVRNARIPESLEDSLVTYYDENHLEQKLPLHVLASDVPQNLERLSSGTKFV